MIETITNNGLGTMQRFDYVAAEHVLPIVSPAIDRVAWLKQRRQGIGSSDCSTVMGFPPYRNASRYTLWQDKCGLVPLDVSDDEDEILFWGSALEPIIRDRLADRLGIEIFTDTMLRSKTKPWQLYDPDGIVLDGGVVEIKNVSQWMAKHWDDDEIPDHAEFQVQHGMSLLDADYAIVAGLLGGNRLVWRTIERNDRLISLIDEAEEEFWVEHVLAGKPPEIDGSDATRDALLASGSFVGPVVLTDDELTQARLLIADYTDAQQAEKRAQKAKAEARNRLLYLMDGADSLVHIDDDGEPEELVRIKRGAVAAKRFAAMFPDIAETTTKKVEVLDTAAVRREHPDEYRAAQAVSIYQPKKKEK
jgi:putative phage-type endonuclease